MSSLLERSLDEIIGSKPGQRSGKSGPRGNRNNFKNGKKNNNRVSKPGHGGKFRKPNKFPQQTGRPNELKITNLHPELTTEDLTKLMETIGPTISVHIKFNTEGKSTGIAFVEYEYGKDAMDAIKKFDGRLAAGQIINVSSAMSLMDRIGTVSSGKQNKKKKNDKPKQKPKKKEFKTLDDLDKELSMYMNGGTGAETTQEPIPATITEEQQQQQQQIMAEPEQNNTSNETVPIVNDVAME